MSLIKRLIAILIKLIDLLILSFDVEYLLVLEKLIDQCKSILDLGCGCNSPLGQIKKARMYTLGIDIFEKYIEISKKKRIHDDYLLLNLLNIDEKISPKSFDCVLLLDVIEHLKKLEGIKLIKKAERIAKKKVIIFTTNGFVKQEEYHKNIYQRHYSGWDVKEFKKMGFIIYGIKGLKFIRGKKAIIKLRPFKFWNRVSKFSNLFVKHFPQFAFELLCVKEL